MAFWWPLVVLGVAFAVCRFLFMLIPHNVPSIEVDASDVLEDRSQTKENSYIYIPRKGKMAQADKVQCYEPATMKYLGFCEALTPEEVKEHVAQARDAQKIWASSSFRQRRQFLRILLKISSRDTGKTMVDASLGEIMTTCEKITWLLSEGEKWLKPEYRSSGRSMLHKRAKVEFHPLGVIGAIVSWNYPFHNVFNPMLAAVFSGNAAVIKIMQKASETLIPVTLELGGKDAFIVCEDVDLATVGPENCRTQGPPLAGRYDMGAICMQEHSEKLQNLVNDAQDKGAEIAFGPIIPIMKFSSDEEAIKLANDSKYGLGCAVFSGNQKRAIAIASQLHCGVAAINDFASTYMCQSLPFGGVKHSGFGRFAGVEGLRACCLVKSVVVDRWWPFIKTVIPKPIQYPVAENAFVFQESLVEALYGLNVWDRLRSLINVVKIISEQNPKSSNRNQRQMINTTAACSLVLPSLKNLVPLRPKSSCQKRACRREATNLLLEVMLPPIRLSKP
ncbi:Aldehyde dehydrogenase family [Musa troglodytarum]|uniref:Aldehyde dehydrogenase family n=1 Tax=Musa troglodytarum TaxID=320322 RepID=A0A9E7EJ87_9LILI|nr:Aldehyde dehydrogenase family [Musa troglodytarum]URD78012.1 Aldehyde dehydrogenase family [Musa troglodytarum]